MKKLLAYLAIVVIALTVTIYVGCKKDETPVATCSDGIQNQSETGIDCGGPCTACATSLCLGNSTNNYFPLTNANFWQLDDINPNDYERYTISGTAVYNSITYNKIIGSSIIGSWNFYLRKAANGDIYYYETTNSTEYLYIPASPTVNQSYPMYVSGVGSRKVISTNATVTSPSCTYTGCLQIQDYNDIGSPITTWYYKKGVGLVCENSWIPSYLSQITLH